MRPDYVIHTAAPFIDDVDFRDETKIAEVNERTNSYKNATKLLARSACHQKVRKVVMTGAATSVVGDSPLGDGVYRDSNDWAKDVNRPNERAKFLAERACWDEILLS